MRRKILGLVVMILIISMSLLGAEEFRWDMAKGSEITVALNQHMYTNDLLQKIDEFEKLTGIKVHYTVTPEENYFDRISVSLNSRSGQPDVFMTGAYQVWDYAPAGYMQDLDEFINDPSLTSPDYNVEDFFEGILGSLRWDLVPGHKLGNGPLWAIPMAFEMYTVAYNERIFKEAGVEPPTAETTFEEFIEIARKMDGFGGRNTYGVALRGTRNWATIHPGYMTTYVNYGAKDFEIENNKLVSKVNSPEAVEMTEKWVELIIAGGAPNWSTYTWYQAQADLGAGQAAMMFDADIVQYGVNVAGSSPEAGNIAFSPAPLPEGQNVRNSNLWVWSLAMNNYSKNKTAAWLFIQYFTSHDYQLWAAVNGRSVNSPRESVFNDPTFREVMSEHKGYLEAFEATIDNTVVQFTPQPHFTELTTEWAATLQDLVFGRYPSVQAGMDDLKKKMDRTLDYIDLSKY